jgi:hypothetical protein
MIRHLFIPDTQCKPDVPLDHLDWAGRAIMEYRPDVIIHTGDHWDLPSLSHWDRNKPQKMEGRRLKDDIAAGNEGMRRLLNPLRAYRKKSKGKVRYNPRLIFIPGNHEDRLTRQIQFDPYALEGLVSFDLFDLSDWEVIPYLQPITIDGIAYCHYFYNSRTGKPFGGKVANKMTKIQHSFTMGHQQGLEYDICQTPIRSNYGLVAGSFYLHDEEYLGPQGSGEWRGIIVKNDVRDGRYDIMPLSVDYLRQKFS